MSQIKQIYSIKAPVADVWRALTDASVAEQWGASPAKVDAREGGVFSYWDGDIHGINTKIIPEQFLEQDWYGHDNPEQKYTATFIFEADGDATIVTLLFAGDIKDEQKDIKDWKEYYFDPIKELLERDS